jgi:dephospho-CoA kinase
VYRAIGAGMKAFELTGAYPFVVVDVPLLYETGGETRFDRVIVTICPPDVQLARLTERGLTDAAARQRLAAQWPADAKAERADFVVRTDGTFEDTNRQVDEIRRRLSAG